MDVRVLTATDYLGWRSLWDGYLDFYGVEIPEEVTAKTFARLTAEGAGMQGLLAVEDGQAGQENTSKVGRNAVITCNSTRSTSSTGTAARSRIRWPSWGNCLCR